MRYAQIDELGFCIVIMSGNCDEVSEDILIVNEDIILGQRYDRVNKIWTNEFRPLEPLEPQLTLEDVQSNVTATKNVAMSTEGTVMMTSEDALTIMEYQTVLDEKLSKIITHLGL